MSLENVLEAVYASLENDNENIDECITELKAEMQKDKLKEVEIDNNRLPVPNRQGRQILKSYFKKRGVKVSFNVV